MTANTMKQKPATQTMVLEDIIGEQRATTTLMDASHRCDRCGAQALVRAEKGNFKLLFCGHHAHLNIPSMSESGWLFDDQSDRLMKD